MLIASFLFLSLLSLSAFLLLAEGNPPPPLSKSNPSSPSFLVKSVGRINQVVSISTDLRQATSRKTVRPVPDT